MFIKEKNRRVYRTYQKNKMKITKVYSKVDRSKEKEIEKQR